MPKIETCAAAETGKAAETGETIRACKAFAGEIADDSKTKLNGDFAA